jgi:succinate dehydrogenase / fumarate reductase cytochrome b subunit
MDRSEEQRMNGRGLVSIRHLVGYHGGAGQWAFVLHRLSGLGVLLFLLLHILDTSTVYFAPQLYNVLVEIYKKPLVGLAEVALGGALVFHAVNGVRITVLDFWPALWRHDRIARGVTWLAFLAIFVPLAAIMLIRIWRYAQGA